MNDIINMDATGSKSAAELESLKTITTVVYVLQALSYFTGITGIVGVIINYVKRDDARGTLYESHFDWQIRTFWWGLLWFVLGMITIWIIVGFFILFAAWVWSIYRVVKGFLKLNEGKKVEAA